MSVREVMDPFVDRAADLARRWADATKEGNTRQEAATTAQIGALVRDAEGLDLAVRFVDRVARPEDTGVAAKELTTLGTGAAGFLAPSDRVLLGLGSAAARAMPGVVVPAARMRLRQMIGHLVVDARDPALGKHLAKARQDGFRMNVNLLGEAVLGETEAMSRTARVAALLSRPDVDYVSIKVSSLVSQIVTWDHEGTVQRCLERLRPLYRVAAQASPHKFVNLDMEEYRDLDLTIELFERILSEEEFKDLEAGIVLQAYLPDALPALERLIGFARRRRAAGGAGIKVRLVKGANLAMEQVEAAIHGWEQAPYDSKHDVDANYLRCIERALRPDAAGSFDGGAPAVRLGVASHNLYNVALAHLLATDRGVAGSLDVEMLQGMAPSQARAVKADVGTVLLYTPVVAPADFDVAVSYLIRRLEENAGPENFLHATFSEALKDSGRGHGGHGGSAMDTEEARFRAAVAATDDIFIGARRTTARPPVGDVFANTPDSDPSLAATREWGRQVLAATPAPLTSPVLADEGQVADAVARGLAAGQEWLARPVDERAGLLREAARQLEARRGELLTVMAAEGGKTLAQSDPEVSEAIDFARYYADSALDVTGGLCTDGARFEPSPLVLVTPPWNFPVAIPIGGVLAALAAGSAVIIKPAHPTPGCVEVAAEALWAAGVPRDLLQVVRTGDRKVARALVAHPQIGTVILTGSSETARMFAKWRCDRPGGARVYGETSGKNSIIVTPAADLDLAVADVVTSAFGHAGQKCSAASLVILVGSVGTSERFKRQLIDATASVKVGWPGDISATMGPVIEEPEGKLRRALTTLEPGETWLVQPRQLDDTGRLWSPGLKDGVTPGSFFHLTEVFGPVLGIMRAHTLDEAIDLANAVDFGLTSGLHSLDEEEIERWLERIEAGNAYVNRHITGAIVRRQSFGGWKESSVGPGAKAGGPNYVAQLGRWVPDGEPSRVAKPGPAVRRLLRNLLPLLAERPDRAWVRAAAGSDAYAWEQEFSRSFDESALVVESNVFRYLPAPVVWVRTGPTARTNELIRLVLGAACTGTEVRLSLHPATSATLKSLAESSDEAKAAFELLSGYVDRSETDEDFIARIDRGDVAGRLRLVRVTPEASQVLYEEAAAGGITVFDGPMLANGRRELLLFLREQAISRTMHRFGHLQHSAS